MTPTARSIAWSSDLPRPVWLLDVDGVLNASRPGWGKPPVTRVAYADGLGYKIRFAVGLCTWLRRLHAGGRVDIRWATTWVDEIDQIEKAMRLPSWPCAFSLKAPEADGDVEKYRAAIRVVEVERRPLIWTDDAAIPADGSLAYARLTAPGVPLHIARPQLNRGLQPADLVAIEAFLSDIGH